MNTSSPTCALAVFLLFSPFSSLGATDFPITGSSVPELAAFDAAVTQFMQANSVSAATLAIMKDGRLVLQHSYGWSDRERIQPLAPGARFRLASNSKDFTAAAAKLLIERGTIQSNTLAVPASGVQPSNGKWGDTRYQMITVSELVAHSGGWDTEPSWFNVSETLSLNHPATIREYLGFLMAGPLQYTPGTRLVYSGEGYALLAQVVAQTSGSDYLKFLQQQVCRPWGIQGVERERTMPKLRTLDEPWYDSTGGSGPGPNLAAFPTQEKVNYADGAEYPYENLDGGGSLIASAESLVRLAQAHLVTHGNLGDPNVGIPTYMNGDRRRFRHLHLMGGQHGNMGGVRSFCAQNTNGVDFALMVNREVSDPSFSNFVVQLKRLTEQINTWPGDNSTQIELGAESFLVGEEEGTLVVGVRRVGDSSGSVQVAYSTMDGTAHAGTDYEETSGVLTFADDEITQTISIPILNNALPDGDRKLSVNLTRPSGGAHLGVPTAVVTIEDDDAPGTPPAIQITSPASGAILSPGTNTILTVQSTAGNQVVSKVEYFAGLTLLDEENKPPYTFNWPQPAVGSYALTARITDIHGLVCTSIPVILHIGTDNLPTPGSGLLREFWTRRPGSGVTNLTDHWAYPDQPTGWDYLSSFQAPTNWGDYYGSRLRGYLIPPQTGGYQFSMAADEQAELWLSSDEAPDHKQLVTAVLAPTPAGVGNGSPGRLSEVIQLAAGQRYYVEVLHKERFGADSLAVGWQLPDRSFESPISAQHLEAFDPSHPFRVAPPVLLSGAFTVKASSEPGKSYVLESSPDLRNWLPLQTNISTGFIVPFASIPASIQTKQFYRVSAP